MKRNFVEVESYLDRLGQEVKVGDIVMYPRMWWSSPKVTFGKIVNIRQRKDWHDKPYITVRIEGVTEGSWGIDRNKYPDAALIVDTFRATLANYKNLIKIDPNILIGTFKDVLIDKRVVVVYCRKIDDYNRFYYTIDDNGIECEYRWLFKN